MKSPHKWSTSVQFQLWGEKPADPSVRTDAVKADFIEIETIKEQQYYKFYLTGIAAKQMTDYKYAVVSVSDGTIPSSVTSIGNSAFYVCGGLKSIIFQGTKTQWEAITKGSYWNDSIGDYTIHCTDGDIAKS